MTIDFLRHAEVVENRMRRLVCRNAIERDMFEGERFFTGSDEKYSDRLPIGVFKDLTETPLDFDGMSHAILFLEPHTIFLLKAHHGKAHQRCLYGRQRQGACSTCFRSNVCTSAE